MSAKVRENYLPKDSKIKLHRRINFLKQNEIDVIAYTEEFQKLSLRGKQSECGSVKVTKYLNGLRLSIYEELNLLCPDMVHKCYQLELKVEAKLKRRQEKDSKGRGRNQRGRGKIHEDHKEIKKETSQSEGNFRGNFKGRRGNSVGLVVEFKVQ